MAIRGSLSEASLADVLQLLALGQKTGCLSVAREGNFGAIDFVEGRVVHASLVNRRDRLADRLIRAGMIAADDLSRLAVSDGTHDDRSVASELLNLGVVPQDVLLREYQVLVEEAVYQIFGWSRGTFSFEPEDKPLTVRPFFSVSADSLLLEGARRVDEWTLIEKRIPSLDLIFEVDSERLAALEVALSEAQEGIVPLLDGTHDVTALVERSGLSEFEVGKALYGLISAGCAQRVGRSAARRQPPPESRVAEHRNLGIAFYRTGMLDEAQREFQQVLELRDGDGVACFHMGLVHARRGAWRTAFEAFGAAAESPEAPAAVFHNLAFCSMRLGDHAQASGFLAEAEKRSGSAQDPRLAMTAAELAMADGDVADAEQHLSRARGLWGTRQPSGAWFHMAGLCAAFSGDTARAAAILDEGITIHPHSAVLHNNLAVVQERCGSYETAARMVEHALLEDANCPHLHKNLGDYLYRSQRYDEAYESFARVVRLSPKHGPDVYLKNGNVSYRRGNLEDARLAWQQALTLDPGNRIVLANLAALPVIDADESADEDCDIDVFPVAANFEPGIDQSGGGPTSTNGSDDAAVVAELFSDTSVQ